MKNHTENIDENFEKYYLNNKNVMRSKILLMPLKAYIILILILLIIGFLNGNLQRNGLMISYFVGPLIVIIPLYIRILFQINDLIYDQLLYEYNGKRVSIKNLIKWAFKYGN